MSTSIRDRFQEAAMGVHELGDIDQAITSAAQRRNRTLAIAAGAGLACVAIVAAVFFGTAPGASPPKPLQSPTPSPSLLLSTNGWPTTSKNVPGVYSLGSGCGTAGLGDRGYCKFGVTPNGYSGWMHNGYGSGDVEIRVKLAAGPQSSDGDSTGRAEDGEVSAVVAGHEGTYRPIDARRELWFVDVEGTTITVKMTAKPGTSSADLAEAHAIIDSMRSEQHNNSVGLRVVFTLTTNDWDSG